MRSSILFILISTLAAGAAASALEESKLLPQANDTAVDKIVNGVAEFSSPSVVALLGSFGTFCTGTLIGCETVLTAAHCVCSSDIGANCQPGDSNLIDPESIEIFAQHGGFYPVVSVAVPTNFNFAVEADIAVIKLATAVNGISPSPINTGQSPDIDVTGTITGFGTTDSNTFDSGIKRTGQITSASCILVPGDTHICWDFLEPLGFPGQDSNTCFGDSGGPLFMDLGAGAVVAGVSSGSVACDPPSQSFSSDVFLENIWIQSQGNADLSNAICGDLPQVGNEHTTIYIGGGTLDTGNPQDFWQLELMSGVEVVRFVLNGEDGFFNDFDLFVKRGSPPSTTDYDCGGVRPGTYEACEIAAPEAGIWHLLVNQASGSGGYQIVATVFEDISLIFKDGFESGDVSAWSSAVLEGIKRPSAWR